MEDVAFVVIMHWHGFTAVEKCSSYEGAIELGKIKLDAHPHYEYFTIEKRYYS